MQALIWFFVELCLLRRAPQDLPGSTALFALLLGLHLATAFVVGLIAGLSAGTAWLHGMADLGLLLGVLYGALAWLRLRARFLQAATALQGAGILLSIVAIVPLGLHPTGLEPTDLAALGALLLLALVVWSLVVAGHIIRHTFGISLARGVVIAVLFEMSSFLLISAVLPSL